MINSCQKCIKDILPSARKTELARNWKKCFAITWDFRKHLEFMDINLEAKVSTVISSEIGSILRSTFINDLDQGLSTLAAAT